MLTGRQGTEPPLSLRTALIGSRSDGWSIASSAPLAALAVSVPLAAVYLALAPSSGDLAAATYRGNLFARAGFTLWDNGWYGGHYVPGYSLLAPALGALVGERALLAASAVVASGLFGVIAQRTFHSSAGRAAGASFALGVSVGLLSGRVAYGLGVAFALFAVLLLIRGWTAAALVLGVLTSVASPVAGAFLALAGLAYALTATSDSHHRRGAWSQRSRGLALAGATLAPILALALAFPEGGWQPFAPLLFWPVVAGVISMALLLHRARGSLAAETRRMLTVGAWLYALALAGSFLLRTPVGSNAERLGALVAAPLAVGLLWEHRRLALALLAPALLYWQLQVPVSDFAALIGNPSVNASYYAPLVSELQSLAHGRPLRVEVPMTEAHWESVYLPEHPLILLARGWERQLDTRDAAPFYRSTLSATTYRSWLAQNAVSYVAIPDVRVDSAGEQEERLIATGPSYLTEVWHSKHWRLFAVRGTTPLAQRPAVLSEVNPDSFTLIIPRPGTFNVRVHFTRYWTLPPGLGSLDAAPGGWTEVHARRAGTLRVEIGV
jgi:hypothetical protein